MKALTELCKILNQGDNMFSFTVTLTGGTHFSSSVFCNGQLNVSPYYKGHEEAIEFIFQKAIKALRETK